MLAKILGLFQIQLTNISSNEEQHFDVLVLENVFSGRQLEQIEEATLLVHPHSHRIVKESLRGDTRFLADFGYDNYTLQIGRYQQQVVIGIADYAWSSREDGDPDEYKYEFRDKVQKMFLGVPGNFS